MCFYDEHRARMLFLARVCRVQHGFQGAGKLMQRCSLQGRVL